MCPTCHVFLGVILYLTLSQNYFCLQDVPPPISYLSHRPSDLLLAGATSIQTSFVLSPGTWKQEMDQKPWRRTAYWVAPCGFLSLLSYTFQEHLLSGDTAHSVLGPPTFIFPTKQYYIGFFFFQQKSLLPIHVEIWVKFKQTNKQTSFLMKNEWDRYKPTNLETGIDHTLEKMMWCQVGENYRWKCNKIEGILGKWRVIMERRKLE